MELAQGPTLAERIQQGPIPLDEALHIARQIAGGLEYAHESIFSMIRGSSKADRKRVQESQLQR
jgi:serine/threonine protein kinase